MNPQAGQAFEQLAATLDAHGPVVLPALLLCDFGHLANEVERLESAGAAALHLDVMDGRFVPQLTYGMVVVEAVRRATKRPIEVHLMVEEPESCVEAYANAGVDIVTVHVEGLTNPRRTLEQIASLGSRAHLAISPGTPAARVEPYLDVCDGVLVMSVEPGFGGQAFNPVLAKLSELAALRSQRGGRFRLAVDGGISTETIGPVAAAGAELIVAGKRRHPIARLRVRDFPTRTPRPKCRMMPQPLRTCFPTGNSAAENTCLRLSSLEPIPTRCPIL